jgi:hypothetical protein
MAAAHSPTHSPIHPCTPAAHTVSLPSRYGTIPIKKLGKLPRTRYFRAMFVAFGSGWLGSSLGLNRRELQ